MKLVARTFAGFEPILEEELIQLGATNIKIKRRAIEFEGDKALMYRLNIFSRFALDILMPVFYLKVRNTDQLYDQIKQLNWSKYLKSDDTFLISTIIYSDFFDHSQFAMLRAKDGIVDHFKEKFGKRPDIDKDNPKVNIVLRITNDLCEILLNSSGEPLFKRGYRKATGEAPLNEVLAAGIIKMSGWDKQTPLIDPMCGSGTIPIEAAMMAQNIAPGLVRKGYGFQKWHDYDRQLFTDLMEIANRKITDSKAIIIGNDKEHKMVQKAQENVPNIPGVRLNVKFEAQDFFSSSKQFENGIFIFNPPYDKRISLENADEFYDKIGTQLKHQFEGYDAWIFTSNLSSAKRIGLKPSSKTVLYNGPDESRLLHYALYRGSKKVN